MTTGGVAVFLVLLLIWAVSGSGDGGAEPGGSKVTEADGSVVPVPSDPPASDAVPQAATRPVRTTADLDLVCGNTYFPTSPKFTGKAPHPVVISARDRLDLDHRSSRTLNRVAFGGTALARRTWAPAAAKAQLVACLDLIGGGTKVKDCKTDEAKRPSLPLQVGRYRLTVYEVATRRKVAEATLAGTGKDCPWVVMTGADPTLYTPVDDNQLFRALRKPVVQGASAQPRKRS